MSRRLRGTGLIGVALTCVSGCTTLRPVPPRVGPSELEVRFATPRPVAVRTQAGAEVIRRDVTGLSGRPLAVRGDTLVLLVGKWRGYRFWVQESPPVVAEVLVSDASTDVGTRRFSAGRTAALILGPPAAVVALLFALCPTMDCFAR